MHYGFKRWDKAHLVFSLSTVPTSGGHSPPAFQSIRYILIGTWDFPETSPAQFLKAPGYSPFLSYGGVEFLGCNRFLSSGPVLYVCYLENHVFLGTRIDRKISARHVFIGLSRRRTSSGRDKPKSFFIGAHGQELLAPHTSGPRDVPRCGALSLLQ
jgi:hypothetical protein